MLPAGGAQMVADGSCGATYISRSALDQTLTNPQDLSDVLYGSEVTQRITNRRIFAQNAKENEMPRHEFTINENACFTEAYPSFMDIRFGAASVQFFDTNELDRFIYALQQARQDWAVALHAQAVEREHKLEVVKGA